MSGSTKPTKRVEIAMRKSEETAMSQLYSHEQALQQLLVSLNMG